jgi:hypothetical protein
LNGYCDGGLSSITGFKNFKECLFRREVVVYCNNYVTSSKEFRRPSWTSKNSASHDIAFKIQTNLIDGNFVAYNL